MKIYLCLELTDEQLAEIFLDAHDAYMTTAPTKRRLPAAVSSLKESFRGLGGIVAQDSEATS
jgi:hypothetical protein